MAYCKAKTKAGKKCRATATANGLCPIHQSPNRASEMSQKGVAARRLKAENARKLAQLIVAAPKTPEELKEIVSTVIASTLAGKIDNSTARAVASLSAVMLKAFDHVDVARELKKLEQLIATQGAGVGRPRSLGSVM